MVLAQEFVEVNKAQHDIKAFDCGKTSMNEFLYRFSTKHGSLGLSRTYVLLEDEGQVKRKIAAYFTLASSTVTRFEIPTTQSLPSYPIPVIILARLAVDKSQQGNKLGTKSLVYALRQSVLLSQSGLPAYGLILDVLDDSALKFYNKFNLFKPFTDNPMRLFVPMKTLTKI